MNQLHSFLKKAHSALKNVLKPAATDKKVPEENAILPGKKETPSFSVIGDAFIFHKKRPKKNGPAAKKETGSLHISAVEKWAFNAYQQNYTGKTKLFVIPQAAYSYGQSQKLMMTVQSGLRPLPVGMVTMLDLCQHSIQSSLI